MPTPDEEKTALSMYVIAACDDARFRTMLDAASVETVRFLHHLLTSDFGMTDVATAAINRRAASIVETHASDRGIALGA